MAPGLPRPPRPVWHHTFDLRVYRGAVRRWLDGHPVYDFVRPQTQKGFTYPPFAVLVLLPLAWGTETTATVLLTTVTAVLVVGTTVWIVAPVADRHGWPRWVAFGVAVPLAFATEPVRETLGWGQVDLVVAALVLADVGALRRSRPWAGVGIGLATAIKVTPALFVVYLAGTRRWRAAGIACGTFGVTVLAGFMVDPSTRYWTRLLWQTDRVGHPTNPNDQSLLGLLAHGRAPARRAECCGGPRRRGARRRTRPGGAAVPAGGRPRRRHGHRPDRLPDQPDLVGPPPVLGPSRRRRADRHRSGDTCRGHAGRTTTGGGALGGSGGRARRHRGVRLLADLVLHAGAAVAVDGRGENAYVFLMLGLVAALPARELRTVLSGSSASRAQPRKQPSPT